MARSTFGERFGYSLWLLHLKNGAAPKWRDVARAIARSGVTRSGEAIAAWVNMEEPPDSHSLRKAVGEYTGLPATWLFDGEGTPPNETLWSEWAKARRVRVAGKDTKGARPFDRDKAAAREAK